MAYRVVITVKALKQIKNLDAAHAARVRAAISALADFPRPVGAKKLVGTDEYRIRVGDYRILYTITDKILLVEVVRVAHRREAYRK
jgi:mRNA interferase RelE/StbE